MTFNIPVFAKRDNPIKRAIIQWLESQFPQSNKGSVLFRIGDLEDGVREILGNPKMKSSSIRAHTGNLKTDKFITPCDSPDEEIEIKSNESSEYKPPARVQDSYATIGADQLAKLLEIRNNWEGKQVPSKAPARTQR